MNLRDHRRFLLFICCFMLFFYFGQSAPRGGGGKRGKGKGKNILPFLNIKEHRLSDKEYHHPRVSLFLSLD